VDRGRLVGVVGATGALLFAGSSCAQDDAVRSETAGAIEGRDTQEPYGAEIIGTNPKVVVQNRRLGESARLTFTLGYERSGECFIAKEGDSAATELVVWPPGTRPLRDGSKLGVAVPVSDVDGKVVGERKIWEGERVTAGGGYHHESDPPRLSDVSKACYGTASSNGHAVISEVPYEKSRGGQGPESPGRRPTGAGDRR
jgi:hypothetical protein